MSEIRDAGSISRMKEWLAHPAHYETSLGVNWMCLDSADPESPVIVDQQSWLRVREALSVHAGASKDGARLREAAMQAAGFLDALAQETHAKGLERLAVGAAKHRDRILREAAG